MKQYASRRPLIVWIIACISFPIACGPVMMNSTNINDNTGNGDSNSNTKGNANNQSDSGTTEQMAFGVINGEELLVEGTRSNDSPGETSRRDERFTAVYSLKPTSADTRDVIINFDQFTTAIFGEIAGTAHLTYEESGSDFNPELECPTTTYAGSVEWDVQVVGSYDYIPALGTIMLTARAENVSSPPYMVKFNTPGCPEQGSGNASKYIWPGPGQGAWGFVDTVLENGRFESRLKNPFADDLGAKDYYEIQLSTGP